MATLRVHRMRADAAIPSYESSGAAGLDLAACLDGPITLDPGQTARVPTGIRVALPSGHEGQVRPRSGLAARHAVTVVNAPGTIDEDYRGELQVLLINHGRDPFTVRHGERIAQLVVAPVTRVEIATVAEADDLGTTDRGDAGFGSTGR
ncbi:MAG: dUTP diphosphatase [Myxococcota bacterium]